MRIDIFYKSYSKDFKLLKYSLQSLKKNIIGYNDVIILIPTKEFALFWQMFRLCDLPLRTRIVSVEEYGNGYLYQQWCKLSAHRHSDAEFIMFSDSDIIFNREINLQEAVKDGKPEILYTSWDKVGDAICWKKPTEDVMKQPVSHEFMRRNNLIYHRSTLENINTWWPKLEHIVMSSERFSEFNLMGAYAYKNEKEKYSFTNTDNWQYTPPLGEQLWGWAEKNNPSEPHPYEYARSLRIINEALNLNIIEI